MPSDIRATFAMPHVAYGPSSSPSFVKGRNSVARQLIITRGERAGAR
jgi:hypothetical protein